MKRRTTIVRELRENITANLEFAGFDETLGNAATEAYRRGLAAAYASAVCLLVEEGSPEWLEANHVRHDQAKRITALRATEETPA